MRTKRERKSTYENDFFILSNILRINKQENSFSLCGKLLNNSLMSVAVYLIRLTQILNKDIFGVCHNVVCKS